MISDLDIWRSANTVIEHHGDNAENVAAMRRDAFLAQGNLDGNQIWTRILAAIKELRRDKPASVEMLN